MKIHDHIKRSIAVKEAILADEGLMHRINSAAEAWIQAFQNGGKVLFCGNGGSAADAQHLSAELSGRFAFDRPPLFAEALHVNTSYLTAVANDYSYEMIYARMVEAAGRRGDVLVAISTSGNSPNIIKAAEKAREIGMTVIGMTGSRGGTLRNLADILLNMPSDSTPHIQEAHITIGHILCDMTEWALFGE